MATLNTERALTAEFSKSGYAKRFAQLDDIDADCCSLVAQLAGELGCAVRWVFLGGQVELKSAFELPKDSAAMVLDLTAYYGVPADRLTREQHIQQLISRR